MNKIAVLLLPMVMWSSSTFGVNLSEEADAPADSTTTTATISKPYVKKVLFIGDSMTGWMSERLEAYGQQDGFEVSTVLWDGSTITKWAKSGKIASLISQYSPDVVFISLGMNELLERNPEQNLKGNLETIKKALGTTPYLWVGPPSWPGKGKGETLNNWLRNQLDAGCYFYSGDLSLPRQSATNPHPTKAAIQTWMDKVVEFIPTAGKLNFKSLAKPTGVQMTRGKVFIYKKMKETL